MLAKGSNPALFYPKVNFTLQKSAKVNKYLYINH